MTDDVDKYLLVLTNLPDEETAMKLARSLVSKRLAACVNVLNGCSSVYRWQGSIQVEREIPMMIKTRVERYASLQEEILALHPYELPEIIALPLDRGLMPYLEWVSAEVDISA
jgi:periplasmic divalent cation tolerance protein